MDCFSKFYSNRNRSGSLALKVDQEQSYMYTRSVVRGLIDRRKLFPRPTLVHLKVMGGGQHIFHAKIRLAYTDHTNPNKSFPCTTMLGGDWFARGRPLGLCYLLCDVPPCRRIHDLDHLFLTFGSLRLGGLQWWMLG